MQYMCVVYLCYNAIMFCLQNLEMYYISPTIL